MREISVAALKHYLQQAEPPPLLLDVREPWEFDIAHLSGAKLIPLSQLAQRLGELENNREIIVMCHHGIRSKQACLLLQAHGFRQTINLRGGVDSWAKEVDASMPVYS